MARQNLTAARIKPAAAALLTLRVLRRERLSAHFSRVTIGQEDAASFTPMGFRLGACPLATFRENTILPVSSTAHAWWKPLPTSIPTHILRTATRPVLPSSQLNPVDDPPASP
jgi:NADPH-dependent ferric siderophore reductase